VGSSSKGKATVTKAVLWLLRAFAICYNSEITRHLSIKDWSRDVTNQDKAFFVTAYFEQVKLRIEKLATLRSQKIGEMSFKDEAFILCLVYIDGLASCYYGNGKGSQRTFCQAMRELSGNPVFGKLHAQVLLDPENYKLWKNAAGAKKQVEELVKERPGELLDESEIAAIIRQGTMLQAKQDKLIDDLWRFSIGAICYRYMRCAAVHGFGAGPLSFSETVHEGKQGFRLDFDVIYAALRNVGAHVAQVSIEKGEWFGRPDYLKSG